MPGTPAWHNQRAPFRSGQMLLSSLAALLCFAFPQPSLSTRLAKPFSRDIGHRRSPGAANARSNIVQTPSGTHTRHHRCIWQVHSSDSNRPSIHLTLYNTKNSLAPSPAGRGHFAALAPGPFCRQHRNFARCIACCQNPCCALAAPRSWQHSCLPRFPLTPFQPGSIA